MYNLSQYSAACRIELVRIFQNRLAGLIPPKQPFSCLFQQFIGCLNYALVVKYFLAQHCSSQRGLERNYSPRGKLQFYAISLESFSLKFQRNSIFIFTIIYNCNQKLKHSLMKSSSGLSSVCAVVLHYTVRPTQMTYRLTCLVINLLSNIPE